MSEETEVQQESGAEEKAREMGWTPKDEWKGDPEKWIDADEFVERGNRNNGILRERNDKLLEKVASLEAEIRNSVRVFGEATRKTEERAYKQALADLKAQKRDAVEAGDTKAFEQLENAEASLQKEYQQSQGVQQQGTTDDPVFSAWREENEWYEKDVEATEYAERIAPVVARNLGLAGNPNPTSKQMRSFYESIAEEVKRKHPEKFRNTRRDGPSAVEGDGAGAGGKKRGGKSYADLPPEAKAACDKFVKSKVLTREQYVKDYFGE